MATSGRKVAPLDDPSATHYDTPTPTTSSQLALSSSVLRVFSNRGDATRKDRGNKMSNSYSVNIGLDDETLTALHDQKQTLSGYKGLKTGQQGGASTVWIATNNFSRTTQISWQEQYGAYIDNSQVLSGGVIVDASNNKEMNLGQTLEVNGSGVVKVVGTGTVGDIDVKNTDSKPWISGMTEVVNGSANPLCAFPLNGLYSIVMEPIETILLTFRGGPVNTGTVEEATSSQAIKIVLSGENPSAAISFNINEGWDTKGLPNASILDEGIHLASELILPIS